MNLQDKYESLLKTSGEEMILQLSKLSDFEQEYINARVVVESLKEKLKITDDYSLPWQNVLKYKKDLMYWMQKVSEMESKQHLA